MALFKKILILVLIGALATLLVYASFAFGETNIKAVRAPGNHDIKKSIATLKVDPKGVGSITYAPYKSGTTLSATGILSLDFGRLSTAFVMASLSPEMSFSGQSNIYFSGIQGIISLYDPFSLYTLHPKSGDYQIKQITNGSFYVSDEPDGTVSIYSIDVVAELSFYNQGSKMTDMILFPGMYIRFDPRDNAELRSADLFKIMLVLGDNKSDKNTGLEFVNPRVSSGKEEDIFFMFKLPPATRPLFQMLHVLFAERIAQADLIKNYTSTRGSASSESLQGITNPSKKNHYLLDDLKWILSKAVQSQMDSDEFKTKINALYSESRVLVQGNSVQLLLESFLTDTRFAIFKTSQSSKFNAIYIETASILGISPTVGKGKFFQYLSDIYSRNIYSQKRDPTFSGIDTYTPTADGLKQTIDNSNIESKDYFDIALYAYQLLQKAQDGQVFTNESLGSKATYDLMGTLFNATEKYISGLDAEAQKAAYQTLVIQFYAPIASTLTKSLYATYGTHIDDKMYLNTKYLDGNTIKFDENIKENIDIMYMIFRNMYEKISPYYAEGEQNYALLSFRDSVLRVGAFLEMTSDGAYKAYQQKPHIGIDVNGIFMPSISTDGKVISYDPTPILPPVVTAPLESAPIDYSAPVDYSSMIGNPPNNINQ